ncbi:hypothetical protein OKW45_001942 [Paraburkholderia sp. WSM4175]|uniref:hypothetical protein n=1 Tax=Paraburkholderia sp. WSM4175 TaxID=2991072 RepID=UPI003D1FF6CE
MKHGDDHDEPGLWSNVQHLMALTGWTQARIAELMFPYTDRGVTLKVLKHSLATMISRKQHNWKYAAAFAKALGLPLTPCLTDDFRRFRIQGLQRAYGFNLVRACARNQVMAMDNSPRWKAAISDDIAKYFDDLRDTLPPPESSESVKFLFDSRDRPDLARPSDAGFRRVHRALPSRTRK